MAVVEIYSKRQKKLLGEISDVYQYETIPAELRAQVVEILNDAFGKPYYELGLWWFTGVTQAYEFIHKTLRREIPLSYTDGGTNIHYHPVVNFLLNTEVTENAIDVIQLAFQAIDPKVYGYTCLDISPDEAIDELNYRLRQHGVGYQYESGQIIRVDSEFIHSEAMKPALKMLSDPMYKGANQEFLSAHKHYRAGEYKECLNNCLKSFESCLKAICDKWSWDYDKEKDTANRLLQIVFDKELIPTFMQSHFSALKSLLASGVPTVRNRRSGHGQGSQIVDVPDYIAAYALHLTASNILLLANADAEKLKQLEDEIPF